MVVRTYLEQKQTTTINNTNKRKAPEEPFSGPLSPRHGPYSGFGQRSWPPDMEGSCKHNEYALADSLQRVVLQLGGWAKRSQMLAVKIYDVAKHKSLGLGMILWLRIETGGGRL